MMFIVPFVGTVSIPFKLLLDNTPPIFTLELVTIAFPNFQYTPLWTTKSDTNKSEKVSPKTTKDLYRELVKIDLKLNRLRVLRDLFLYN